MNFKKFIPLSLATMSMMGAFTACSDNKVVGADEQTNTMAELSSSSVEPGSSNSLIVLSYLKEEGAKAALVGVSKGTAVTYSHIEGEPVIKQIRLLLMNPLTGLFNQSLISILPYVL